ncbi:hypothetical protein E4S40_03045 [Algoriphagus kandeliae]|uniref:Hpt domain-containing protein n=1 Tax=Algoriphagus kandeliae TaxID=2562278 RepID=A0A4Y9QZT4_9BACT|nr:hypothetical protein [Algoriphagus kandeliae]TFV97640.1 hypothetical protein E4S40_03045 [Algoriphagus kandeliae]
MSLIYPELNFRIEEMSDGDEEFKKELTQAIFAGLMELKQLYSAGMIQRDLEIIQQIRHKVKPTLGMFEFEDLANSLQNGKEILESTGFGPEFQDHYERFIKQVDRAIDEVKRLVDQI